MSDATVIAELERALRAECFCRWCNGSGFVRVGKDCDGCDGLGVVARSAEGSLAIVGMRERGALTRHTERFASRQGGAR